jgi:hypothetical protein
MDFFKPFQNPPGPAIYQFQYPIVISEEHPILLRDTLNLSNFPSGKILAKQSWFQDFVFRNGDQFSAKHTGTACQAFWVIGRDHNATDWAIPKHFPKILNNPFCFNINLMDCSGGPSVNEL